MSILAQKVVVRYILARRVPEPAQIWRAWSTTMHSDPFGAALGILRPLLPLGIPKIDRLAKMVGVRKDMMDRVLARHNKSLVALRGQGEWTPELIEVVQKVSNDRDLLGFLKKVGGYSIDLADDVGEAVADYAGKVKDLKLYRRFDVLIDKLQDEAEKLPQGILDPDAKALGELMDLDYRPALEFLEKYYSAIGYKGDPEEPGIVNHLRWLRDLEKNPKLLEEWEDHTPSEIFHDMGDVFMGTPLYQESERVTTWLKTFTRDAENLLDMLEDTKRLGVPELYPHGFQ